MGDEETRSPAEAEQGQSFGELQSYVPQDILDVSLPIVVRGYDRRTVDAQRVNRVIAELKGEEFAAGGCQARARTGREGSTGHPA